MPAMRMELSKEEVTRAVDQWLRKEHGVSIKGDMTVNHYPGGTREPSSTTFSVSVEPTRAQG